MKRRGVMLLRTTNKAGVVPIHGESRVTCRIFWDSRNLARILRLLYGLA